MGRGLRDRLDDERVDVDVLRQPDDEADALGDVGGHERSVDALVDLVRGGLVTVEAGQRELLRADQPGRRSTTRMFSPLSSSRRVSEMTEVPCLAEG